jgi:serum/glucocorticoid-regulated kinase 2
MRKLLHFKLQDKIVDVECLHTESISNLLDLLKKHPQTPKPHKLVGIRSLSGSITLDYILSI